MEQSEELLAREEWRPIETAPTNGDPVELACFRPGNKVPDWCACATWGVVMPSHTRCASKSGWYVEGPLLETETGSGRYTAACGFLTTEAPYAPTHWRPLPDPPNG